MFVAVAAFCLCCRRSPEPTECFFEVLKWPFLSLSLPLTRPLVSSVTPTNPRARQALPSSLAKGTLISVWRRRLRPCKGNAQSGSSSRRRLAFHQRFCILSFLSGKSPPMRQALLAIGRLPHRFQFL